jgi:hypothetical protein
MENQSKKYPYHYWQIHKRVMSRMWKDLSSRQRELIAHDTDHTTETFQRFDAGVKAETERLYQDPTYFFNEAWTFKMPYWEPSEVQS